MTRQTGRTSGNPARDTKVWRDELRPGDPMVVERVYQPGYEPPCPDPGLHDIAAEPLMSRAGCAAGLIILAFLAAIFLAGIVTDHLVLAASRAAPVPRPNAGSTAPAETATQAQLGTPRPDGSRWEQNPGPSDAPHGATGGRETGKPSASLIPPLCSGPCPTLTPRPRATPTRVVVRGIATTYGPGYDGYLAWPDGRGWRLRICGPADCVTGVSNDAGPSKAGQRAGHVIDLDVATFEDVCGVPWRRGVCPVTVVVLGHG